MGRLGQLLLFLFLHGDQWQREGGARWCGRTGQSTSPLRWLRTYSLKVPSFAVCWCPRRLVGVAFKRILFIYLLPWFHIYLPSGWRTHCKYNEIRQKQRQWVIGLLVWFLWVAEVVLKLKVVERKLYSFVAVTFEHEVTVAVCWVRLRIQRWRYDTWLAIRAGYPTSATCHAPAS